MGFDILFFGINNLSSNLQSTVTIDVATGRATSSDGDITVFSNFEGYAGTEFSDLINGSHGDDIFAFTNGFDSVLGGAGIDTLSAELESSNVILSLKGSNKVLSDVQGLGSSNIGNRTGTADVERFELSDQDDLLLVDENGLTTLATSDTFVDGGLGLDELTLQFTSAGPFELDFSLVTQIDNIDALDLTDAQEASVLFRASDIVRLVHETDVFSSTFNLSPTGALEFVITGGSDDFIGLVSGDGWQLQNSNANVGGQSYTVLTTTFNGNTVLLAVNNTMNGDFVA
jgi:hypothetical protein